MRWSCNEAKQSAHTIAMTGHDAQNAIAMNFENCNNNCNDTTSLQKHPQCFFLWIAKCDCDEPSTNHKKQLQRSHRLMRAIMKHHHASQVRLQWYLHTYTKASVMHLQACKSKCNHASNFQKWVRLTFWLANATAIKSVICKSNCNAILQLADSIAMTLVSCKWDGNAVLAMSHELTKNCGMWPRTGIKNLWRQMWWRQWSVTSDCTHTQDLQLQLLSQIALAIANYGLIIMLMTMAKHKSTAMICTNNCWKNATLSLQIN